MATYEEAIRCPRCGRDANARAEAPSPVNRLVTCSCPEKSCPYYGRRWFLAVDQANNVLYHTNTLYSSLPI